MCFHLFAALSWMQQHWPRWGDGGFSSKCGAPPLPLARMPHGLSLLRQWRRAISTKCGATEYAGRRHWSHRTAAGQSDGASSNGRFLLRGPWVKPGRRDWLDSGESLGAKTLGGLSLAGGKLSRIWPVLVPRKHGPSYFTREDLEVEWFAKAPRKHHGYRLEYKYIWLSRGSGKRSLDIQTMGTPLLVCAEIEISASQPRHSPLQGSALALPRRVHGASSDPSRLQCYRALRLP